MKIKKKRLFLTTLALSVLLLSSVTYAYFMYGTGVAINGTAVYGTPTSSTKIGYIGENENVYIGWEESGRYVVDYKIPGGTKSGYVSTSAITFTDWQWPVEAINITNDFNNLYAAKNSYHLGIDMKSTVSDNTIRAPFPGVVISKGTATENGNYVRIKHVVNGKTLYSFYAHLKYPAAVNKDQEVEQGDTIGIIGSTGASSTGPHLHFSISDKISPYGYSASGSGSAPAADRSDNKIIVTYPKTSYFPNGEVVTYYNPEYIIRNNGRTP